MASFKYKGYTLTQRKEGEHHYIIYNGRGKPVIYAAYTGGMFTQAEAEHVIDNMIAFRPMTDKEKEDE